MFGLNVLGRFVEPFCQGETHSQGVVDCTNSGPNGLQLISESDRHSRVLTAEVTASCPGTGSRHQQERKEADNRCEAIVVGKPAKDYGLYKRSLKAYRFQQVVCDFRTRIELSLRQRFSFRLDTSSSVVEGNPRRISP